MNVPLVGVGVPVYNGERYLARALDSLLAQTFEDFEIIICDNASEDSTPDICVAYAARDPRIRYHRNPRNMGLVVNFNRTFEMSRGAYFNWATHDDWHAPEFLEMTVKALDANPMATLCATGVSIVDEDGQEWDRWIPSVDFERLPPHERMRQLLLTLGRYPHQMFGLLRSSALSETRLMQNYLGSDRVMLAEMSLLGPMVHVPETLHFYTVNRSVVAPPPSIKYDPTNVGRVQLRTWRLIYEHLRVVERSDIRARHKLLLAGSVLRRFGIRDFRRLLAEIYHYGRMLGTRAAARLRSRSAT